MKKSYKKNGFVFNEVSRRGDIAIYSQHLKENSPALYYEVFLVQIHKERIMPSGKLAPERETCPSNEKWGLEGFTFRNLADAQTKAMFLQQKVEDRKLGKGKSFKTIEVNENL